jgi:predicted peptidase
MAAPDMVRRYPCFLLAVQCPSDHMWVNVPWSEATSQPWLAQPSPALRAAEQAMELVLRQHDVRVDLERVYLTGLSMGGFGTWDWAMRDPLRFAAIVPVCGGGDERQAHRLGSLPVWAVHGAQDSVVPVQRSRAMVMALQALGQPVRYTELPEVGHDAWLHAYGEDGVLAWMFAQDRRKQGGIHRP